MWKQRLWTIAMALAITMGVEKTVAGDEAPQSFASKRRLFEQKAQEAANPTKPPIVRRALPKIPVVPEPVPEVKAEPTPEATPEVKAEPTTEPTPEATTEPISEPTPERKAMSGTHPQPEQAKETQDCSKCSEEDCKNNKGQYEVCKLCFGVDIEKCLKGASDAGFVNKAADFKKMNALSEGKGVKAKDVLPRFNSIATLMKDLHTRISHLKNPKVFLKKQQDLLESIDHIKKITGLADPNINPEQELKNYDAVLMTSISGGIGGLSMEICNALVNDFNHKVENKFKSFTSKVKGFVSSQTKHEQEFKTKQLNEAGKKMNDSCKGWKLATQLANQEQKDVYEVLQNLWKVMDEQLQAAQTLLTSKP